MSKRSNRYAVPMAILALAFGASSLMAAGAKKVTGTINGSISASNLQTGACAPLTDANGTDSYDTICGHSGSCRCLSASGLSLTGGFGRGTVNASVTVDTDSSVKTGLDVNACSPAFGVFSLTIPAKGKIAARTQTINATGAICGSPGISTVVALGGFSIEGSTASSSGSGTFNGTVSTTGSLSVKLVGLISNP